MVPVGRDASVRLEDGRILEYWEGGDPGGAPVIVQPGTLVTRILGRWAHTSAAEAGVRLVFVNRPGYGGTSVPEGVPGLRSVGEDTVALATQLRIDDFAVIGYSGGGPFAAAAAIAAPGRVRALGIVGGSGPWAVLGEATERQADRACLALLSATDPSATWACFRKQIEEDLAGVTPSELVEAILSGEDSPVVKDPAFRALLLDNMRSIQASLDGYVFDNIACGRPWDIDPHGVDIPTILLYGSGDTVSRLDLYGRWYADQIPKAKVVVIASPGHVDTCEGHWPEVLRGTLATWAGR